MAAKLKSRYDVLVVGAGPAGLYTSLQLAKNGFQVLVIEEHERVGKPRFCTGLIGKEAFDKFPLSEKAIENSFNSASFISPLGIKAIFKNHNIRVYATDRSILDHDLYLQAKAAGVEFLLNSACSNIKIKSDCVELKSTSKGKVFFLKGSLAVLATGIKYNLHRNIGLSAPEHFLDCAQVEVAGKVTDGIEIHLGNDIAPHSFAWVVPLKDARLRIGISTYQNSLSFIRSFLSVLKARGIVFGYDLKRVTRRPIPFGMVKSSYAERVLTVGDAAGQTKPTTGGGVYFGLLCADLAAQVMTESLKKRDFSAGFLRRYENSWKKKIEFDLTMSLYLRKLLANSTDNQLEEIISFCAQVPMRQIIEKHADFNHHGRLIKELIKNPLFWRQLYRIVKLS